MLFSQRILGWCNSPFKVFLSSYKTYFWSIYVCFVYIYNLSIINHKLVKCGLNFKKENWQINIIESQIIVLLLKTMSQTYCNTWCNKNIVWSQKISWLILSTKKHTLFLHLFLPDWRNFYSYNNFSRNINFFCYSCNSSGIKRKV